MKTPCHYCGRNKDEGAPRCRSCGLGIGHLPWDHPEWEQARFLDPGLSWMGVLWEILGNPNRFFASIHPRKKIWRSWTLPLPVVYSMFPVVLLAAVDHLAEIEAKQPLLLNELSRVAGRGALGVLDIAQSLILMSGYWGLFVAMVATLTHLGLLMTGGAPYGWKSTFKMSGYALVPAPLIFLLLVGMWLALDTGRLGGTGALADWMRPLAAQGLLWALLVWPFLLMVIGLERMQGVRRGRAISSVVLAMMTGLLVISLVTAG